MRRTFFLILLVLGMPAASFCQVASSDPQTLQALLAELRHGMIKKSLNPFRISLGNRRVYTTFAIELKTLR